MTGNFRACPFPQFDLSFSSCQLLLCAGGERSRGLFPKLNLSALLCLWTRQRGPSSCVTGMGNQRLPRRLSAAGLEVNGAFAGLFPSAAFSQTSATPLEGTSDFQGAGPNPLVMVCGVKELEGSPVQLHGSKAAPSQGQRRGAGAKERSACSSRMSLPVLIGKTHTRVCLHQGVFVAGIGGGELGLRGPLAEQTCLSGSAAGRTRLARLCPLRVGRGERLQHGTVPQALAVAVAPHQRRSPWGYQLLLEVVFWSGNESLLWGIFLFRSGLGLNENSK